MTAKQIKRLRIKLDLTQEGFARLLETSQVTVCTWENNRTKPGRKYRAALKKLEFETKLKEQGK